MFHKYLYGALFSLSSGELLNYGNETLAQRVVKILSQKLQ